MDKVIEAMEAIILEGICEDNPPGVTAKDLLNLRYNCEKCGGDGSVNDIDDHPYPYSKCNGTGKGSRMLAVLAENQEPPENHMDRTESGQRVGYEIAQQGMLRTDADGYAFRRVKVQDDNNG